MCGSSSGKVRATPSPASARGRQEKKLDIISILYEFVQGGERGSHAISQSGGIPISDPGTGNHNRTKACGAGNSNKSWGRKSVFLLPGREHLSRVSQGSLARRLNRLPSGTAGGGFQSAKMQTDGGGAGICASDARESDT